MELMVEQLTKQYGTKLVVDHISLRLQRGVYGLLGANGSGKTTLMRMLCGILQPTEGTVRFDGNTVDTEAYRACLGYLPQDFGYYPDFTGTDFLLYMAALKGLPKGQAKRRTQELLELVDEHKIALNPAYELSFLKKEEQTKLLDAMESEQTTPSLSQAQRLKKFSQEGHLSLDEMRAILSEEKKSEVDRVTLTGDTLRKYFPKSYTPQRMQNTIIKLLEQWQRRQKEQER